MRPFILALGLILAFAAACGGEEPSGSSNGSSDSEQPQAGAAGDDGAELVSASAVLGEAARNAMGVDSLRGAMSMEMRFGPITTGFDGELLYQAPDVSYMKMDVLGQEMEVLAYGVNTYIRMAGSDWMTFDLSEFGVNVDQLRDLSKNKGFFDLEQVAATLGDLRQLEDEEIDGRSHSHYEGDADFDELLEQMPGLLDPALEEQVAGAIDDVSFDFWVDPETDLLRRLEMTMEMQLPDGSDGEMTMSFDYLEYNVPVDIPAEPVDAPPFDPASFGGQGERS